MNYRSLIVPSCFVVALLFSGAAKAACSSPAGVEGETIYNATYKVLQFCDNTNWISMAGAVASGGGALTDGDKGDISVSGSGGTWSIDNGVVSFAKIQNIATSSLLGRTTAGSGSVEEITVGSGLSLSGGTLTATGGGGTPAGSVAGAVQFRGATAVFAADDANLVWDDTNNRLGIGTATPLAQFAIVATSASSGRGINVNQISSDSGAASMDLRKARGTEASPTAVLALDNLGSYSAFGYNGTAFVQSGDILFKAEENFTSTARGTSIAFRTSKLGENTTGVRMVIDQNGFVGVGESNPKTQLHVGGTTAIVRVDGNNGATALAQGMEGVELVANAMSTTQKYTPALKFGSRDAQFTTTTPKFLAGIVGEASENYTLDTSSGMGLVFLTTANGAGATPTPAERMRIDNAGNVGIGTSSPAAKLDVAGAVRATELCDESGANCKDISTGWSGGGGAVVLSPQSSAPAACSAGNNGAIELTGDYTLCVCRNGTGWVSTSNGTTACVWSTRTIVANGGSRNWSDGAYAASCNGYRNPGAGFVYSGSTGDGVYTINPSGSPFDAYCDMTTNSGGWTLIADGGSSCSSVDPKTALNLIGSCGYLAQGTVSSLAGISTEVQLRSGASHSSFSAVNSTDALARSALQSPTGTWHNGASGTFSGWSWSLSCGSTANGWPNMFHACGNTSGVHWLQSQKFGRTSSTEARSSTWLK